MKRAIFLATAALMLMLVLAPVALAQGTVMRGDGGNTVGGVGPKENPPTGAERQVDNLPTSGGPVILLPAAALLLGSGILTYAVLRRR